MHDKNFKMQGKCLEVEGRDRSRIVGCASRSLSDRYCYIFLSGVRRRNLLPVALVLFTGFEYPLSSLYIQNIRSAFDKTFPEARREASILYLSISGALPCRNVSMSFLFLPTSATIVFTEHDEPNRRSGSP